MSGGPGTVGYERWQKLLDDLGESNKTATPVKKPSTTKPATSKKKTNTEIAKEVLAGKWGNGETRKKKLTAAGYDYAAIQKIVNSMLK